MYKIEAEWSEPLVLPPDPEYVKNVSKTGERRQVEQGRAQAQEASREG